MSTTDAIPDPGRMVPTGAPTTTRKRPFSVRDKIGYMFGDFGNDFTFLL
ncbi:MAG: hypothetical protein ACTHV2_13775 [Brachybacterium sp.]|nr:hypothetical protein [Brachybacterium sp.]MDN6330531.1 hypothetical protein [Brachybacterium sp.]